MYPPVMKFCLLLKFLGNGKKAKYQVHLSDERDGGIKFEVEEGQLAIKGKVDCFTNGFPITYDDSPSLPPEQMEVCKRLIIASVAITMPKLLLAAGHPTIWHTHTLPYPGYVLAPLIPSAFTCTQFHTESPPKLAIRD